MKKKRKTILIKIPYWLALCIVFVDRYTVTLVLVLWKPAIWGAKYLVPIISLPIFVVASPLLIYTNNSLSKWSLSSKYSFSQNNTCSPCSHSVHLTDKKGTPYFIKKELLIWSNSWFQCPSNQEFAPYFKTELLFSKLLFSKLLFSTRTLYPLKILVWRYNDERSLSNFN